MHERSRANVKVEPHSTCRLSPALFIVPLFYLRDFLLAFINCMEQSQVF